MSYVNSSFKTGNVGTWFSAGRYGCQIKFECETFSVFYVFVFSELDVLTTVETDFLKKFSLTTRV